MSTLVLHDFDKSGLSIAWTVCHDGRRYRFKNAPLVKDVGLRLGDVRALGLQGEVVDYRRCQSDPRARLARRGASEEEQRFLVERQVGEKHYRGRRVELNELTKLTNAQFVALLEAKLTEVGVAKVFPAEETLTAAFAHCWRQARVETALAQERQRIEREVNAAAVPLPASLRGRVAEGIEGSELAWSDALGAIVREHLGGV